MSSSMRRLSLVSFLSLAVLSTLSVALHAGPAAPAPPEATAEASSPALEPAAACAAESLADALGLPAFAEPAAVTPHCCSQQEINACRDGCKAQGPGCKGKVGCRAGECDCTCSCP
ncbi:MAG: hypothetical protein KDD47_02220 [Acidobacteria bacterium]|nr:hypothetical protein [Acidobacteriota bacterium]